MFSREFATYLLRFFLTFCIFYYGTIAMIGITNKGGYYSEFAARYLDYVSLLRWMLLHASMALLTLAGMDVYLKDVYTIAQVNGLGVHVGYDCIGYGVLFFWLAFIVANKGTLVKKIKWCAGGLLLIFIINVIRIALMLVAVNQKWKPLFNLDNHTLFNMAAYSAIFTMIYFFDRYSQKNRANTQQPL